MRKRKLPKIGDVFEWIVSGTITTPPFQGPTGEEIVLLVPEEGYGCSHCDGKKRWIATRRLRSGPVRVTPAKSRKKP